LNACNPLASRIDKNLGNPVVKKVWGRTLADRRGIRLLSVNTVPEVDVAPTPDEAAPITVNTEENAGGDTSETAHAAELEAALLAASSPGREGPTEPAAAAPTEAPVVTAEAEV
jgi:hypothetical protein